MALSQKPDYIAWAILVLAVVMTIVVRKPHASYSHVQRALHTIARAWDNSSPLWLVAACTFALLLPFAIWRKRNEDRDSIEVE